LWIIIVCSSFVLVGLIVVFAWMFWVRRKKDQGYKSLLEEGQKHTQNPFSTPS
jgi:hypothetical protein